MTGPGGEAGLFERRWDPETRTLELTYAFREDLPAWIDAGRPLVPGKGVPTAMYMTMRMMKQFGVDYGGVRLCRMIAIHEIRSIAQLAAARKDHPDKSLHDLVQRTHSYAYARSILRMSGQIIAGVRLDAARAEQRAIGDLCAHYEHMAGDPAARRAEHDATLAEFRLTRSDEVLLGYDLLIKVEPQT